MFNSWFSTKNAIFFPFLWGGEETRKINFAALLFIVSHFSRLSGKNTPEINVIPPLLPKRIFAKRVGKNYSSGREKGNFLEFTSPLMTRDRRRRAWKKKNIAHATTDDSPQKKPGSHRSRLYFLSSTDRSDLSKKRFLPPKKKNQNTDPSGGSFYLAYQTQEDALPVCPPPIEQLDDAHSPPIPATIFDFLQIPIGTIF